VNELFFPELCRCDFDLAALWSEQDGTTVHSARQSMNTLTTVSDYRNISSSGDISWPAHSLDLSACISSYETTCKPECFKHVWQDYKISNR
jgi:hypothetical protein